MLRIIKQATPEGVSVDDMALTPGNPLQSYQKGLNTWNKHKAPKNQKQHGYCRKCAGPLSLDPRTGKRFCRSCNPPDAAKTAPAAPPATAPAAPAPAAATPSPHPTI